MSNQEPASLIIDALADGRITRKEAKSLTDMRLSGEQVQTYLRSKPQTGGHQTDGAPREQQWER